MNELIAIGTHKIGAQDARCVSARDLHAFLLIGKDFTNWIKDQIQRARLVDGRDFVVFAQQGEQGKPRSEYALTMDAAKHVAMLSQTERGFQVRDYFIDCERRASAAPRELTRLEVLHLALESEHRAIAAEAARDEAIATKHLIGSRREATAMATASAAKREAAKLRDELGFSARHATILQVENAVGDSFHFLPLRKWCEANGVKAETVPDKRYPKGVKAWPAAAWMSCYEVSLPDLFGEEAA